METKIFAPPAQGTEKRVRSSQPHGCAGGARAHAGGLWGSWKSGKQGRQTQSGCFALLSSVVSGALQGSGQAAAAVGMPRAAGPASLPVRWRQHASVLGGGQRLD